MFESLSSVEISSFFGAVAWSTWLALAAGIFALGYGLRGFATYHRSVFWKSAIGTVTEVIEHGHGEFGMPTYRATVQFQDGSGVRHSFVNRRHANDAVHYFAGDEVAIVYNPRRPSRASIEDDLPSLLLLDMAAIVVGLCFLYRAAGAFFEEL